MIDEQAHCETVARDICVYLSAERDGDEFRFLADLIERERDDARAESDIGSLIAERNAACAESEKMMIELAAAIARAEHAEAAAAQMRAALSHVATLLCPRPPCVASALATDVGAGYMSPEQHARAVAEARRQALDEAAALFARWLEEEKRRKELRRLARIALKFLEVGDVAGAKYRLRGALLADDGRHRRSRP